ncbi:MAG: DUF4179 domain-containing protein [Clostridium butyricum]|nr:DUF4179 domain-containing protein [Clostridium butyricum]
MKNNIYDMINDGNFENEGYNVEVLSDIEKKKYKNNIRKSIGEKVIGKRKYKGIAAAMVFVVLGTSFFGTDAGAQVIIEARESIKRVLRVDKNIDDYETVINKCVSDNSVNIQLNEVILNNDKLIVSTNISSDRKLEKYDVYIPSEIIYINNKEVKVTSASGSNNHIDEYTDQNVMEYHLDSLDENDLTGDLDIKIVYTSISNRFDEVTGKWEFEFKTNGDALKRDTYEKDINYEFLLDNGEKITLEKYRSNAISQNIYASVEKAESKESYWIMLKGQDDQGNKVQFCVSSDTYSSTEGKRYIGFKYNNFDKNIDDNVKTLTLAPYAFKRPEQIEGMPDKDEYVKVGEEFIINLDK